MNLNLGSGQMKLRGWVNVDLKGADVDADLRKLPFENNEADTVLLCHVIEHFTYQDAKKVLGEAFRVLRPGGEMIVEGPDVNKIIEYCQHEGVEKMSRHLYGIIPNDGTMADCHKSGWTADIVEKWLTREGLSVTEKTRGMLHSRPWRDYRVVAVK
mgnify:CR=1 FL=1